MSFKRNKLRDAIAFALVVGATATLSTGAAFAQAAAPAATTDKKPATFETIVVTGTRIQSQTVTASSPVTEINAEEFKYSGATRVDDLVNQYPQMNPVFDDLQNNPSLGYPTVDLRGLGVQRTLTLVDGLRLPSGAASGFVDISIIPASLVKRVDILTGGASAVYGSDAIAGVVNFILDTDFEGVKLSAGVSAYRHNNRNDFIAGKLAARGFADPTGDSGFDGVSKNVDIAIGGSFADGAGHAMAWITWRRNEALFQSARDYSACSLGAPGTSCSGSGTNATGNFIINQHGALYNTTGATYSALAHLSSTPGHFAYGFTNRFNFGPLNYYQRPDERYTFGTSVKYDINEHFKPYMSAMYLNRTSATELAPTGTFFSDTLDLPCSTSFLGSLCADLGFDPQYGNLQINVGRRNIEGGARHNDTSNSQFRVVAGVEGAITDNWSYNASVLYGATDTTVVGTGDWLRDRLTAALLQCPAGTGTSATCIPYNVWVPGGVTLAAANSLLGTSFSKTTTDLTDVTGYVTGDLPFSIPSADGDPVKLVAGVEWRTESYGFKADLDSEHGNFAGAGGPALPLTGRVSVKELFLESSVPIVKDAGFMKAFTMDLGYRRSNYDQSGTASTYKIGFNADMGMVRVRGGFNHALRAPNIGELFGLQGLGLWAGVDGCATDPSPGGDGPSFTPAQCANTGLSAGKYGSTQLFSPAGQYNGFFGGQLSLTPEVANTKTLGFVITPIENLQLSLDAYDIKLKNVVTALSPQTIFDTCATTGNAFLCSKIHRSANGDLWVGSDPTTSGFITGLTENIGTQHFRGIDLAGSYHWDGLGGRFGTSLQGTYVLKQEYNPLAGQVEAAKFDCAGKINGSCGASPKWRHIANVNYTRDRYTVNLRWRYFGSSNYLKDDGSPIFTDKLLCDTALGHGCLGDGKLAHANYFDLSASVNIGEATNLSFGVNNIADKEPPITGNTQALNGNSPGGYDQLGRYFFANVEFKW